MKIWWLLGILALILLFASVREGFERRGGGGSSPTPPPMATSQETSSEEYANPTCPSGTSLDVRKKCIYPDEPEMFICPSGYITTGSRTCRKQGSTEEIPPQCSAGKVFDSERGGCVKPDAPGMCPSGYTLRVTPSSNTCVRTAATTIGSSMGQTVGEMTDAKCLDGSSPPMTDFKCLDSGNRPTCPNGSTLYMVFSREGAPKLSCVQNSLIYDGTWTDGERTQNPCRSPTHVTGLSVPPTGPPPSELPKCIGTSSGRLTGGLTGGITGGTTTGGSSTSSFGPNSGGGGNRRNQVFGPLSGGRGEGSSFVPSDSSKTNQYPEIMGGGDNRQSTRIDGAGIVAPSKNWQLAMDGSLPDCKGLGCDENSRYFPFSRQPGDMDLIPDPYRVSQQFSSASYSFKTEPTPFLTDFSAFLS